MPKVIDELATVFDFDFPDDDIGSLASPSYVDIPNGILKRTSLINYALKHACENNLRVLHTCEPISPKASPK